MVQDWQSKLQDWQSKLQQAEDLLAQGNYAQAVFIGGQILEDVLRWLCKELMPRLGPQEQESVAKALSSFGKPVEKLTLGELFGLFYKTKLWDIVKKQLGRDIYFPVESEFLVNLRNRAAHPGGKPISRGEAAIFLESLNYCLQQIKEPEPHPEPVGALRPWHQVISPHRDILENRFDESVFAADLSNVVNKTGPIEYQDPIVFFRRTYLTQGLINLMAAVLSRLAGLGRGEAVIQIQTPFGGGKTHALIALYHLFTSPEVLASSDALAVVLNKAGVEQVPKARVVAFVGTAPDTVQSKTLWGFLAEALGNYPLLEGPDRARLAPGKELLRRLIGDEPTLILMDELAGYLVKAKDFMGQVLVFLQELTEVVKVSPRCALVAVLPSSAPYGDEGRRALSELEKIFGRVEAIYTPVEGEEIHEVIRRRLFDILSSSWEREAQRVAQSYWQLYKSLGDDVPPEAREPAYQKRLKKSYPFHPELIDVLFERWSTFPEFQRTRGVLSFLARVVEDLHQRKHTAPLIQPSHLNLANPHIKEHLIKVTGSEYEGVIASDIAGSKARAQRIDQSMVRNYTSFQIATGMATAIFFYSFSGSERKGVTAKRLRLAVLREGIPPALFGDALRRLEDELWFLHWEKDLYFFSSKPNINRIILEREEIMQNEQILEEIRNQLQKIAGLDMRVFIWPQASQDVPDTRQLKLVILGKEYTYPMHSGSFAEELFNYCGSTFRAYKNTLLVLAPDSSEWVALEQEIRRLLALYSIEEDKTISQSISSEELQNLKSKREKMEKDIPFQLLKVYRHLAKLGAGRVEWLDLGIPTVGAKESLSRRVKVILQGQDLLVNKIAPIRLLERVLREGEREKRVQDIVDDFLRYPNLPMLENDGVIFMAIRQGVQEGAFGIQVGEQVFFKEPIPDTVSLEDAILLREVQKAVSPLEPAIPRPPMPEEELKQTLPPSKPVSEVGLVPPAVKGISAYYLRTRIAWERLSDFIRGVLLPLQQEAEIELEISLRAHGRERGINKLTLEQKVRETLRQIRAEILEEEPKG